MRADTRMGGMIRGGEGRGKAATFTIGFTNAAGLRIDNVDTRHDKFPPQIAERT